jgi:hypothetical protein
MLKNIRLLVSGGRDFDDDRELDRVLSAIHASRGIAVLAEGESPGGGADILARGWANFNLIPVEPYPILQSEVDLLGPSRAPMRRNQRMLDEFKPDLAVCFPGGNGTKDMMQRLMGSVPFMWAKTHPIICNGVPVRPIYEWNLM